MSDKMIRVQPNGTEEIWYSEDYVKKQIKEAHQAGIYRGIEVQFMAIQPMSGFAVEDLTQAFLKRVQDEYTKSYNDSMIRQYHSNAFHRGLNKPNKYYNPTPEMLQILDLYSSDVPRIPEMLEEIRNFLDNFGVKYDTETLIFIHAHNGMTHNEIIKKYNL